MCDQTRETRACRSLIHQTLLTYLPCTASHRDHGPPKGREEARKEDREKTIQGWQEKAKREEGRDIQDLYLQGMPWIVTSLV